MSLSRHNGGDLVDLLIRQFDGQVFYWRANVVGLKPERCFLVAGQALNRQRLRIVYRVDLLGLLWRQAECSGIRLQRGKALLRQHICALCKVGIEGCVDGADVGGVGNCNNVSVFAHWVTQINRHDIIV